MTLIDARALPFIAVAFVANFIAGCDTGASGVDSTTHHEEVLAWREGRLERLKAPTGFLNLAGLFWLSAESTSFGASADNDLVFPAKGAAHLGSFELTADGVMMIGNAGADLQVDGRRVEAILIADDTTENPVTVTHGSLAWNVILRDGRYAIRLRDLEHPTLDAFPPLDYFPIDPSWRVEATLMRYPEPRIAAVATVIEGLGYNPESPGVVVFEKDGQQFELEAYTSGERLFFVFGDQTNGGETYPAGRFLYAAGPDDDGKTVLDFNKSYSPPCAFNDFSTCPVASPRNRLATRLEAGELFNPDAYFGSVETH